MCIYIQMYVCVYVCAHICPGNVYITGTYMYVSILSVESQKGIITIQQCSIENQKGAITVQNQ